MPNAENPKKNGTVSSFAISIWNEDPDTWEHYFDPPAVIKKVNISKVNLWAGEEGVINISCLIIDENNGAIRYKVLVNEEEVIPLSQPYSTPAEIEIPIPKTVFTEEENLFTLVVDESDREVSFSYIITVEDRDTFTFKRVFDFKEDYITDENIEVIYGKGLTLKEIGRGEVNIEIPTEGKSKISNIVIEGEVDKEEEEVIIEREMTYLNDLGEGKVYESRLLTEYSDITNIVSDGDASLIKSNNKYYTYQNNEFIEVEPTVENFKEKSIYLPDLTTPTDKVVLTMEEGEDLENGKIFRKTINVNKYKDINTIITYIGGEDE